MVSDADRSIDPITLTHRFAVQEGEEAAEQRLDAPLPRRQPHQHLVCCRGRARTIRAGHGFRFGSWLVLLLLLLVG